RKAQIGLLHGAFVLRIAGLAGQQPPVVGAARVVEAYFVEADGPGACRRAGPSSAPGWGCRRAPNPAFEYAARSRAAGAFCRAAGRSTARWRGPFPGQ
nr:hypothetical protein [Tanacetum cinerariifolium]